MQKCQQCEKDFEIKNEDREFYDMFQVPDPIFCPKCRLKTRLAFRNAKSLYKRKCDFSGKEIISQYNPKQPFPVYDTDVWFSDQWDVLDYGRDFDFNRDFFDQIKELADVVPHMSRYIISGTMENSEFTNCAGYCKNCYLVGEADYNEDCYFSNRLFYSKNCIDCSVIFKCELCYECIDCNECFNVKFSQDTKSSTDSYFLLDCRSCQNCIGCVNQRYAKYKVFNKQYSKDEYDKKIKAMHLETREGLEKIKKQFEELVKTQPRRNLQVERNENSLGNYLYNSKNAYMCFDSEDLDNCRYCTRLFKEVKSCMDHNSWGDRAELLFECNSCGNNVYDLKFCHHCMTDSSHLEYCIMCNAAKDCFGCVGLNKNQYCILNKQYSKQEYKDLKAKIIDYMKKTGEYGRFFPRELSDYGYNETIATDYYPLTKKEAEKQGFGWYEKSEPPAQDNLTKCKECGKNIQVIKQEKEFLEKNNLPKPELCPDCRHKARQAKRTPPEIFKRKCVNCHKMTLTSAKTGDIYCDKCFKNEVY
ncbi:hypothetical protein KKC88_05110 [Patescibacteria group bacterium]|nr:hypothetical protein [Patescibacteria group bacterium]MBU1673706.1 hypothetical protein [Patescibacteria group bacterium]MBU1963064.1 hypothetical protein [Patescibacteria group bacterium]